MGRSSMSIIYMATYHTVPVCRLAFVSAAGTVRAEVLVSLNAPAAGSHATIAGTV
ncbi:hypothetical protein ANABIO32_32060 [Rossellomorea marisflavi]|nr:hypothetical protein ANABIO32_32060 [Rossellomorea marisflavi]